MAFIRTTIQIGDRVVATRNLELITGTFTRGHRFKVIGSGDRGYDLIDDDGNRCLDVPCDYIKKE